MNCEIRLAGTDAEIAACFPVMHELRPHLVCDTFVDRVRSQERSGGFRIVSRSIDGQVVAVAGFRILDNLAWGRLLYVDDLVTSANARSNGHGSALLQWLESYAAENGCARLHLDSGVQRLDAHRFYDREGFARLCIHFAKPVENQANPDDAVSADIKS
ncbi:GNAT family N-acetyltransferase [bacterium]|nr:GNAT family N-acetyltransferase [bacterium]